VKPVSLKIPTAFDLARAKEWERFKEDLAELQEEEAACSACFALRRRHETENVEPVCKAHARTRRDICFGGWS
jgi:recombinational DNA repair protein RecR